MASFRRAEVNLLFQQHCRFRLVTPFEPLGQKDKKCKVKGADSVRPKPVDGKLRKAVALQLDADLHVCFVLL